MDHVSLPRKCLWPGSHKKSWTLVTQSCWRLRLFMTWTSNRNLIAQEVTHMHKNLPMISKSLRNRGLKTQIWAPIFPNFSWLLGNLVLEARARYPKIWYENMCVSVSQFSHSAASNSLWLHGLQTLGFPVYHQLPEYVQTHIYRVNEVIQASHPLSLPFLPTFTLSQHQGLFQWASSSHQVAKVVELQLQHQSF